MMYNQLMLKFKETAKNNFPGELILFITAVFGSILYISLIFNDNLWVDEAFTASLIRGSMPEVLKNTAADTLPPFYNVAGKLLTLVFGFSPTVLKLFSCFPMILLIFFGGRKLLTLYGFRTAFIYELFLFSMPHFLHYGVEIRMYSWGVFACGMAALFFSGILKEKKGWTAFMLFTVFSGYIHHFALVSCGMLWFILLIILLKKKDLQTLKKYVLNLLIFFILYLPCMILTVFQLKAASSYFAMAPLTFGSFLSDIRFPFVTNITPLSALLFLSAAAAAPASFRFSTETEDRFTGLFLISAFYLTLLFGYGVSLISGRSFFTARYLVPALSILWMGIAVCWDRLISITHDNRFLLLFAALIIVFTGAVCYRQAFREEYKEGAGNMKAYFDENFKKGDGCIVLEDYPEIEICLKYYCPDLQIKRWKDAEEVTGTLWLFLNGNSKATLEKAGKHGYNAEYISDFSFDRYSFSLYRLKKEGS